MRKIPFILIMSLAALFLVLPSSSSAQVAVGISVHVGPPAIPVYPQPICPAPGYIWTPGYWAWGPAGYYWVPGTWVPAPAPGLLWTPGYWGWGGGVYVWHAGYWGPHVGFYGGINYGFGYFGSGFVGGEWRGGVFAYNTAVTHVNTTIIHNTYINRTVIVHNDNRVSYNGGVGGVNARANSAQLAAERDRRFGPTAEQTRQVDTARDNRQLLASNNHGRPPIAATSRPGEFSGHGVVASHAANTEFHPPTNRGTEDRGVRNSENTRGETPREQRPGNSNPPRNNPGNTARPEGNREPNQRPEQTREPHNNTRPEQTRAPHNNARPEAKPHNQPQHESHGRDDDHPRSR
ncbi:MAG TPA: hypothetical protein VMJ93_06640 [Verrucomicrobiae bacterium]|nr:hypothetical protein [Verrucomicrobiae bacterium]